MHLVTHPHTHPQQTKQNKWTTIQPPLKYLKAYYHYNLLKPHSDSGQVFKYSKMPHSLFIKLLNWVLWDWTHIHTCVTSLVCEGIKCRWVILWPPQLRTTNENTSRLGYKHVCINYLHVASHDYHSITKWSSTHTHPHTHWVIHSQNRSIFFLSLNSHLSFNINSSGEWKFQILLNQKQRSQACHKQTKERVRRPH